MKRQLFGGEYVLIYLCKFDAFYASISPILGGCCPPWQAQAFCYAGVTKYEYVTQAP